MTESQQKRFIELIYDHQSVFSLCDEDLGLCDRLKHTIPTTMDKPIYLPHCIQFRFSYKLKFPSALTAGYSKVSSGLCEAHMHCKLSMSIKKLGIYACAWILEL